MPIKKTRGFEGKKNFSSCSKKGSEWPKIFFLYYSRSQSPHCRFAVSINGKVGKSFQRSYMKRRMREWFRKEQAQMELPYDIWVSVKRRFDRDLAPQVEAQFSQALKRIASR